MDIIIFNDLHTITIPFTNLCRNDEYVSFFLYELNWFSHCNSCEACKSLLNDVGKISNWSINIEGEIKAIELNVNFGDENNYIDGLIKYSSGVANENLNLNTNFYGTKMILKTISLEDSLYKLIINEQYEKCIFYRDVLEVKLSWQANS